jgi:hypothetical protein
MPVPKLLLVCALLLSAACVEKEKHVSQVSEQMQKSIMLSSPPKPQHTVDIQFGSKVKLLGYDLSTDSVKEGEPFKVTWYWHVLEPLGEGWKVFTHLGDPKRDGRLNLDSARPVRSAYPEDKWKAGQYLRDEQEVTIPRNWDAPTATFFLGFYKGDTRLPVKGPADSKNRARALTIQIGAGKDMSEGSVPRLVARKRSAPIKIDGKLDEADWSAAQPSGSFVATMTGAKGAFEASVRVVYDADQLYLGYKVEDDYLKSTFAKNDDHLWEQDCVEVMVDPNGDGKSYFEAQVAPSGRVFDTRYDARRLPRPFGDMTWSSLMTAAVSTRGKLNDEEADQGYDVELAIPWGAFDTGPDAAKPPAASETWRMNFFVMDAREKNQRAAGWSAPLIGDFHTLGRFGRVVFPEAARAPKADAPLLVQPQTSTDTPAPKTKKN